MKTDRKSRKKLRAITLGCSKNTVDTEHLLACLADAYDIVSDGPADILLINTCGFIGDAKEESVNTILEAVEEQKEGSFGSIVVFGCLSQRYAEELKDEIPEVDAWFGARDLSPLLEYLGVGGSTDTRRFITEPGRPYAYLKISEGCDRRCSYCAIPFIRGAHKSVPVEVLVDEARKLAAKGIKELEIIAQDSTFYGIDLYHRRALADLLKALSEVEGIEWLRIHYSYPASFPEDVLDQMARNPKICAYMDIPLQHISDRILDRMHRGVDGKWTRELIKRMRDKVPGVVLRTTMIVGFPGETEDDFNELLDFVKEARFERLGAFVYSEEEGTFGAENFKDDVDPDTKARRLDELMKVQSGISLEYNRSRIGSTVKVLVDDYSCGMLVCRSQGESPEVDGEILVKCADTEEAESLTGSFIDVRILSADVYDVFAERIQPVNIP